MVDASGETLAGPGATARRPAGAVVPRRQGQAEAATPRPTSRRRPSATRRRRPTRTSRPTTAPPSVSPNPNPWETVVRIKVKGQGSIGFGSGTIIDSTPEESIILTCAHIFKLEGRQQAPPARFPREIAIDLFDGQLSSQQPPMVHYANETYPGKAIDYDFARDVGLIRIRPGRKLPHSRVVPAHWKPKERMRMTTVGCSEGHDATAWSTMILNPAMRGSRATPTTRRSSA